MDSISDLIEVSIDTLNTLPFVQVRRYKEYTNKNYIIIIPT
jgi:hypothetical protein